MLIINKDIGINHKYFFITFFYSQHLSGFMLNTKIVAEQAGYRILTRYPLLFF